MLDVQLAAALLRALPPHCQLVLIGDPNQLPPVGPGSVLQDMLASRIFPRVGHVRVFVVVWCGACHVEIQHMFGEVIY
jgi:exodeoxyribonuclease V alpha subunit